VVINPLASNPVPTLQPSAMVILGLLLASLGILLMKRSR
jgi:LPXTG-motif cell wall-anchored protein